MPKISEYSVGDKIFLPIGGKETLPLVEDCYKWVYIGCNLHVEEYELFIKQLEFDF